jgi:Tol biopolymer transport system component
MVLGMLLPGFSFSQQGCTTDPKSGVQVCQLTRDGDNVITYYDTPLYSSRFNEFVYTHHVQGSPPQIMLASVDSSDAKAVAYGQEPTMGPDGTNVYYISRSGAGEDGMDLFKYDMATHHESRITHIDAQSIIRYSVTRSGTSHGDLLLYSADNTAHIVFSDGAGESTLPLADPYATTIFHRLRLSPTQPNLMFYNREFPGQHRLFVFDIKSGKTYLLAQEATHMLWSPDGLHVAYTGGSDYRFHITRYDGTDSHLVDPAENEVTNYCSFSPEGDFLACSNWGNTERGPLPESIFLLAADGSGQVTYLAKHNAKGLTFWGEPALEFFKDRYSVIFRSDESGTPQIYLLRLPEDIYRRLRDPSPAGSRPSALAQPTERSN